jgi:hypothetical protein
MKKLVLAALFIVVSGLSTETNAQLLKDIKSIFSKNTGLTQQDAANGIKEALIKGTSESVLKASQIDGYFKNPEIKIPFPKDAKNVEKKLRAIGLGKQVDNVILSLNRAAEDAAKEAKPIFIAAIKGMTITDAINIVKGSNDEATKYLNKTTSPELNTKFQPIIKASLDKVDGTKYWRDIMQTYNKIPFVKQVNPDLTEYVTSKAIEGLFIMIAQEELKIRKDPVARTSELLRKVFGN